MNYFSWFFRSLVIYSTVTWRYSSTAYHPLTFNPHTLEIYDSNEVNSNQSHCRPCAFACPSKSAAEKGFETIDFRYRSVFIQQIVDEPQQQNMERIECQRDFEMAVLLHSKKGGKLVEFGFQVYFEKSKFKSRRIASRDFYKFMRVSNAESMIQRMFTWKTLHLTLPWNPPKSIIRKWGFLWLSKIEVRYDFSSRILTSLRYKVRSIKTDQLKVVCHDHGLNGAWYNLNEYLNKFYMNRQRVIFEEVKIPERSCRSNDGSLQYFRKHNLVLPYQFQVPSQNTVSCSNMTTIPLWNDIPDVLMYRMQLFLIAIAQVLGEEHELIVLPGVLGELHLPSVKDDKPIKIFLDDEDKKVPVPKIIYKIVRHRTHKCNEKKELCWFDVVIVIHNYPEFTKNEKLCPIDKCEKLGWESIQYLDWNNLSKGKSPLVYCCELNAVTAKSIAFRLGKTRNSPLNLINFSKYDHSLKEHQEVNILEDVLREFKKLVDFKNEGSQ